MGGPWIYMLGGLVDGVPTASAKKYHIEENFFLDICSLDPAVVMRQPGAIFYNESVYLFDAMSE